MRGDVRALRDLLLLVPLFEELVVVADRRHYRHQLCLTAGQMRVFFLSSGR